MSERESLIPDVPLSAEDEAMMILSGFSYRAEDGILTLSEKGNAFVRDWCRRQMEAKDE